MAQKVALITGGASGMGHAVAQALAAREGWHVHVVDMQPVEDAAKLANITYHQADVRNYGQLAAVFKAAWTSTGRRLDFVFANAGVIEHENFFAKFPEGDEPPPEPDHRAVDVNLKGAINTVRLARHYVAQSPDRGSRSIAVTGSSASIWPTFCTPVYTGAKYGVLGFVRSISDWYHSSDGIRINCLCPSATKTNIVPEAAWVGFKPESLTPMALVVDVVLKFCDGQVIEDSVGKKAETNYGQTVVPSGDKYYLNDVPPYPSEAHEAMARATAVENQANIVAKL